MNERIRELLYKANGQYHGISALTGKEIINTEFVDYAKFAELIVKECSNFLKDTLDDHFAAEQLEEHFGVEK